MVILNIVILCRPFLMNSVIILDMTKIKINHKCHGKRVLNIYKFKCWVSHPIKAWKEQDSRSFRLNKEKKIRDNHIFLLKSLKFKNSNILTEIDDIMMEATWLYKPLFTWNLHIIINFGEYSPTHYFLNRVCCMFLFFRMMFFLGEVVASSKYWRPYWKNHWYYTRSNNSFECECNF